MHNKRQFFARIQSFSFRFLNMYIYLESTRGATSIQDTWAILTREFFFVASCGYILLVVTLNFDDVQIAKEFRHISELDESELIPCFWKVYDHFKEIDPKL